MNMNTPIGTSIDDADVLTAMVIALAEKYCAMLSLKEAVEFLADKLDQEIHPEKYQSKEDYDADIAIFRAALRHDCLTDTLLDGKPVSFYGEFYGSAGSKSTWVNTGNTSVDSFLVHLIEVNVHFEWWHGDGGGGDITWDIQPDVVTINGFQNTTVVEPIMVNEKF